jgi:hypothetical protein
LTISVTRNEFPPVFERNPYDVVLTQQNKVGDLVVTIRATDADNVSVLVVFACYFLIFLFFCFVWLW